MSEPLLACSAADAHIVWVKMLKAQVEAGRYIVDSQAVAKKVQFSPALRDIMDYELKDILLIMQKEDFA